MNENPVDKVKKVTSKHIGNVYDYLFKELKDVVPHQKILDICFAVSNELTDVSIDVCNIYITHERMILEEIRNLLIEKLK